MITKKKRASSWTAPKRPSPPPTLPPDYGAPEVRSPLHLLVVRFREDALICFISLTRRCAQNETEKSSLTDAASVAHHEDDLSGPPSPVSPTPLSH